MMFPKLAVPLGWFVFLLQIHATAAGADEIPDSVALKIEQRDDHVAVSRVEDSRPLLVHFATHRPSLDLLLGPEGGGVLTSNRPDRPRHIPSVYWAFTQINGRDYNHHSAHKLWRRRGFRALGARDNSARWEVEYDLLGDDNSVVLRHKESWTLTHRGDHFLLDLEWTGTAERELVFGQRDFGGLFLWLPFTDEGGAGVVNSRYQSGKAADGERARWLNVATPVDGPNGRTHFTLMDHPGNDGYPAMWWVDRQRGAGPNRSRLGEWTIAKGQTARFRHRLLVYSGEFDGERVETNWREWTQHSGAPREYLPHVAPAAMTAAPGFHVSLFAGEPDVVQPFAICFDDRGRLWLAENCNYTSRGDHIKQPRGRIVILEDTDGDGRMDRRRTFIDDLFFPTGLEIGFRGVWVGSPPHLLFIPDRDGDDRPDGPPEKMLDGWGIRDRHETLNSFIWGPDGWLYGCQGFATPSRVTVPDGESDEALDFSAGWWRYHPVKKRFELFGEGGSNQWGLDFNDHGQLISTACVIPHLWHVPQGAFTQRQGGRHRNPHHYGNIQTIGDHVHWNKPGRTGGHAHGGCRVYLGGQFPDEWRDRVLMCSIHHHGMYADELERKGSGFVGHHVGDFLMANDPLFLGFNLATGPDGAAWIIDWHDADTCGRSVKHPKTGRIYRITHGVAGVPTNLKLADLPDEKLVEMQLHANDWYVRHARRILQERAAAGKLAAGTPASLRKILDDNPEVTRKLRALWALHVTQSIQPDLLAGLLEHDSDYVRAWAIQLACEDGAAEPEMLTKFAAMARKDASPVVRLYLASALQRLPASDRWEIAEGLIAHAEDAEDHNLPLMYWWAIEPLVTADKTRFLRLAVACKIPLVRQYIARRAAAQR